MKNNNQNIILYIICRQNANQLEEKEKREKEMRNQIIEEANQFKEDFHKKRELACENNKAANREKEKVSFFFFFFFFSFCLNFFSYTFVFFLKT